MKSNECCERKKQGDQTKKAGEAVLDRTVGEGLTTVIRKTRLKSVNERLGGGREEKRSRQWEPQVQNLRGGNILDMFREGRRAAHQKRRKGERRAR